MILNNIRHPKNKNIKYYFLFLGIIVYISFSDMYYYLPPMFSLLFLLFDKLYHNKDKTPFLLSILVILFYESAKGYLMLSMIVFIVCSYKFVMPYFRFTFNAMQGLLFAVVGYAYIGSYLFTYLMDYLLYKEPPHMSYIYIYYIIIEYLILTPFIKQLLKKRTI